MIPINNFFTFIVWIMLLVKIVCYSQSIEDLSFRAQKIVSTADSITKITLKSSKDGDVITFSSFFYSYYNQTIILWSDKRNNQMITFIHHEMMGKDTIVTIKLNNIKRNLNFIKSYLKEIQKISSNNLFTFNDSLCANLWYYVNKQHDNLDNFYYIKYNKCKLETRYLSKVNCDAIDINSSETLLLLNLVIVSRYIDNALLPK